MQFYTGMRLFSHYQLSQRRRINPHLRLTQPAECGDLAARCDAVVVASPQLLETSCSTIEQMRLVSALCWAKNFAEGLRLT